jgi:HTH-type transcriptional repressor of NAD biosynthesis genes
LSDPLFSVCLFGPESTGKTTLARELASELNTIAVPEYGRFYCETFGNECDEDDLRAIVAGHNLLVAAARRKAKRLMVFDTDAVMTALWAHILLGRRPTDLDAVADPAELYILTDVDVPFAADAIRYFPHQTDRIRFFALCRDELERRGLPYVIVSGDRAQRRATALEAIKTRFGIVIDS